MQQTSKQKPFEVVIRLASGHHRTVYVKASNNLVARERAMKRTRNAEQVLRVSELSNK